MKAVGMTGENIHIPAMFNHNEKDRLIWREGVLKGKGYSIKMTSTGKDPIYVKTRKEMEMVLLDHPKTHFRVKELK
jgi:hypothetical protein